MSVHTHTQAEAEATITVLGAETDHPAFLGCFGRIKGEPAPETEARWNQFATTMWQWGLEPVEDEPHYTAVDGDLVFDHYMLREVTVDD